LSRSAQVVSVPLRLAAPQPGVEAASSLFLFHTVSNVGYSIERAERVFYDLGLELSGGDPSKIHFAFKTLEGGIPRSLPPSFRNVIAYDFSNTGATNIGALAQYVKANGIDLVFIYDIQPVDPLFRPLREAGVRTILSFWGAPIASYAPSWKLALKQWQIRVSHSKVDGLIFESRAMADLGVRGRGIPPEMIDVIYNGVDPALYKPERSDYVYDAFGLPRDRKIVVYAGHMEPRKGLPTLIEAAIEVLHRRHRRDVCFLICGDKGNERTSYEAIYEALEIGDGIRFAGYRPDLVQIYPSCYCGVIPSSGWDSFPRSPLEMAASGLPVIASRLQGLPESVLDRETGLLFEPGNAIELANCIETLLDDPLQATRYGRRGRERCETELSVNTQLKRLTAVCRKRLQTSPPRTVSLSLTEASGATSPVTPYVK
jgi:glycosyltransferase involved in cell wall biosynthesis